MKTILVVEDEQIISDYITHCLKGSETKIIQAYDGKQALDIIDNNNIDLLITDIVMPNMTGLELIKKLDNKIPCIVLSALGDDTSIMNAYELGAIDFIQKPIKKATLTYKVNNLLNQFFSSTTSGLVIDDNIKDVLIDQKQINFTRTEYELFKLLFDHEHQVFSKELIIEMLWHGNHAMSEKLVEVNIYNIRKKLMHFSYIIKTKRNVGYFYENKK